MFYAANVLRGSVPRSGFLGYFENHSGDDIRAAHEALRKMKLENVLLLLEQAQRIVMHGRPLPEGSEPIELLSTDVSEEAYAAAMDELDVAVTPIQESFYECDERIFDAICKFADQYGLA